MAARTAEICRKNDEKRWKKNVGKTRRKPAAPIAGNPAGSGRTWPDRGHNFRSDRERRPEPDGGAGNAGIWPEGGEYAGKTSKNVPETLEQ